VLCQCFPESFPDPPSVKVRTDVVVKTPTEILKARVKNEVLIKESGLAQIE
jgi:hypothetical protein